MFKMAADRFKSIIAGINPASVKALSAIAALVFLSALKITVFNYYLIPAPNISMFKYKFGMTLILLTVLYPLLLRIKFKILFFALYVIETVYILVNMSYYQYYKSYLHIMQWLSLLNEGLAAAVHFSAPFSFKMLAVFIDLPIFIYIAVNYFTIHKAREKRLFFRLLLLITAIIVIYSVEKANLTQGRSLINFTADRYRGEAFIVERYGTLANEIVSLASKGTEDQLIKCIKYGRQLKNKEARDQRPNFIIIQVESMDSSIICQKYGGCYVMPYLQSLSRKNIYYPYVMSYHKGGSTSDAEFSIINSVEPLDGFPALKLSSYSYPNSMVLRLAKGGYYTNAFHGNTGSFFNRDAAFPRMGFGDFYDMVSMNMRDIGWGAPDGDVFDFALNKIKTQKQPFLSYIITMTSHGPFTNAGNYYSNKCYSSITDIMVRDYYNSMSYVDCAIRNFVEDIRLINKNTYIFIVGDHTPNIDTKIYKQASLSIGEAFLEFVPLIIITPDGRQYTEKECVASFLDIAPTILYRSGITFDIKSDGIDLIDPESTYNEIPFKGMKYGRAFLFNRVKQ